MCPIFDSLTMKFHYFHHINFHRVVKQLMNSMETPKISTTVYTNVQQQFVGQKYFHSALFSRKNLLPGIIFSYVHLIVVFFWT